MKASVLTESENKLSKISFTFAQYDQAKNDEGEIEWQGEMYDVAKTEIHDGHVIVHALRDGAETKLLGFVKSLAKAASFDNHPSPSSLIQYLALIFIIPLPLHPTNPSATLNQNCLTYFTFHYKSSWPEILSPPPRA